MDADTTYKSRGLYGLMPLDRQRFPDMLDEIGKYPAASLLILHAALWHFCHNACGINGVLHTDEFVTESRDPAVDNVWCQLQMKEQAIDPVAVAKCLVRAEWRGGQRRGPDR